MKNILGLFLTISCFGINAQEQKLMLASDIWPPFTNVSSETSVALDLVQTALSRANITAEVTIENFETVMNGINTHQFDGSAALWKTAEREKTMIFSEPYLQNQLVLVGRKGTEVNATSVEMLAGKRLGLVSSYAYDQNLMGTKDVELVFSTSDQENLEKLLELQIDYMLVDALLIEYLFQYQMNDVHEYLAIGQKPFELKSLHFALRNDVPDADRIIQLFNQEIKAMQKDGTYNRILNIQWLAVDVDDDGKPEMVNSGETTGDLPPMRGYQLFYNDSSATAGTSYQVNGSLYENWEDVPEQYKKNMYDPSHDPAKGNMIIRF